MKTTTTSALRLISAIAIVSCADESGQGTEGSTDDSSGESAITDEPFVPTSVIDPVTGDQVALNFPSDLEFEHATNSNKGVQLLSYIDEPRDIGGVEVEFTPRTGLVVTAIGARVASSAVTTIWTRTQSVGVNGLLGATSLWEVGADVANPEVWCEADPGYMIAGVGGRISNGNMVSLTLWTYRYDQPTRELDGNLVVKRCGTQASDEQWVHLNDYALAGGLAWWQVAATGVGFRELSDNLNRVRLYYGRMF